MIRLTILDRTQWTPERISTIVWLDADDNSTITTVGGLVSQWNNKSNNGIHCTQSNSGYRPTYVANSFNGRDVIRFPGAGYKFLDFANSLPLNTNNATIFIVCENEVQNSNSSIWKPIFGTTTSDFVSSPTGYALGKMRSDASGFGGKAAVLSGLTSYATGYAPSSNTFEILGLSHNQNTIEFRLNGTSVFTASNITVRTSGWASTYRVGGEYTGFERFYTGDLCEVIVCNTAPSSLITEKIEGYLAHKWGLKANLPTNHPYKNFPPRGL